MGLTACFYQDQPGYCWLADRRWMYQAVDVNGKLVGEPVGVHLHEIAFHHDQDEELHSRGPDLRKPASRR